MIVKFSPDDPILTIMYPVCYLR